MKDYLVSYEIECDPNTESCFVGCEDENCTETYYYAYIERHAATVNKRCGPNVLGCDLPKTCLSEESKICKVTFCNPDLEECSMSTSL